MEVNLDLPSGCEVCNAAANLSVCAGCKVVAYCGREHQTEDWPDHKRACNKIKKAIRKLDEEETILNNKPSDFMFEANPFENSVGHFWGILDTRDYMRARFAVADAITKIDTCQAVNTAINHFMDMLRLNRSDNMGIRDFVPHLLLRLGKDQECYDFLKWWATTGTQSDYDWGNTDLPHLDTKDADVFEEVDGLFVRKYLDLSHCIAVLLIKTRLIMDLESLQDAREAIGSKLPEELFNQVQDKLLTSSVITKKRTEWISRDNTTVIATLRKQTDELFKAIHKANRNMIPALVDPSDEDLTARPAYTGSGDESEMQLVLQQCCKSWEETSGAIIELEGLMMKHFSNAEEWLEE